MRKLASGGYSVRMLRFALAVALLACACPAQADELVAPLEILLTNDDGYDAPGLRALHSALLAEGYSVTVVAPKVNRSGSSMAITTHGKLTWRQVGPGVIAVDGTPADCVRLALTLLPVPKPDLVISGVNFGQNLGSRMLTSGTVGAAVTGASFGLPAIAVSQTVDSNDVSGTVRYFPDAAAFAVSLVRLLVSSGDERLLPPDVLLNVNHPPRKRADVAGVKLTRQGRSTLYSVVYTSQGDGAASMAFAPTVGEETVPDADTTAVAAGYVSVTPLDGSWTADAAFEDVRGLARRLDSLTRARESAARD